MSDYNNFDSGFNSNERNGEQAQHTQSVPPVMGAVPPQGQQGNFYGGPRMNMNVPPVPPVRQRRTVKEKKSHPFLKKFFSGAAIAGICGLCAGLAFTGTTYFVAKATGQNYRTAIENALYTPEEKSDGIDTADSTVHTQLSDKGGVTDIVDAVMPSIVQVTNISLEVYNTWFGQSYTREIPSAGSGVIINKDSNYLYIATNNHVVANAKELTVTFCDNTAVSAEVQGADAYSDLAVVKVPLSRLTESTLSEIKTVTLGNSNEAKVGDEAIVIGNAMGYGQSVTYGVLSAKKRLVTLQLDDGTIIKNNLMQTDAAINPGNSGGALLDGEGRLIGIVSSKYVNAYVEGFGYAIPISSAKPILECLMSGTAVRDSDRDDSTSGKATSNEGNKDSTKTNPNQTAFIGISGVDITEEMAKSYSMPTGIYVSRVYEGSGAADAGIVKRDIITAINGEALTSMTRLQDYLTDYKPGDTVTVTVAKYADDYIETDVTVKLGDKSSTSN